MNKTKSTSEADQIIDEDGLDLTEAITEFKITKSPLGMKMTKEQIRILSHQEDQVRNFRRMFLIWSFQLLCIFFVLKFIPRSANIDSVKDAVA